MQISGQQHSAHADRKRTLITGSGTQGSQLIETHIESIDAGAICVPAQESPCSDAHSQTIGVVVGQSIGGLLCEWPQGASASATRMAQRGCRAHYAHDPSTTPSR